MKLGIVGSREWKNFDLLRKTIDDTLTEFPEIDTIISGGAKGVDSEAITYAKHLGLKFIEYLPDFSDGYNPAKYHERNEQIATDSDLVLAFWDGKSKGTQSTITYCEKHNTPYRIYNPKN